MKIIPQNPCCRGSRVGCDPLMHAGNTPATTIFVVTRALPGALMAACLSILCVTSIAQTPDNVAEREVQRRQAAMPQGEAALARGKSAMKAKNYTLAHEEFKAAVGSL